MRSVHVNRRLFAVVSSVLFVVTSSLAVPAFAANPAQNRSGTAAVQTAPWSNTKTTTQAQRSQPISAPPSTPTSAPRNVRAFTGGNNIALLWDGSSVANINTRYEVLRDGVAIGTNKRKNNYKPKLWDGTRYYDWAVEPGKTYSYSVVEISGTGTRSAPSTPIKVTHPLKTSPVPTVYLEAPPDLIPWLESAAVVTIHTWYPKVSDLVAYPDYTPPATITVRVLPDTGKLAFASNGVITIDEKYVREHPEDHGVFIHEATHVMQDYKTKVDPVLVEGLADWAREYVMNDRDPRPPQPNETWNSGYSASSFYLNWVMATYKQPGMLRQANVAAHAGKYNIDLVTGGSGKTPDALWTELLTAQTKT